MAVCPQILCPAAVTNVLNNGVLRSGFLVGTGGSSGVEVSLDSGAFARATGTTNWSFQLPTGAATWRESSQHTITVRAAIEGAGSSTITVRKGVNLDINGDGYPDTVVGTGDQGLTNNSVVFIYLSDGSGGLPATATASITGPGTGSGNDFGYAVGLGDFDADGYADLAVGAYQIAQVFVFRSTGSGGIPGGSYSTLVDTTLIGGGGNFGCSLAVGDVDGDGYADLAVGGNVSQSATIFLSSHASTGIVNATAVATISGATHFGLPVMLGDLNGDGASDLMSVDQTNTVADIFMSTPGTGLASTSTPTATLSGLTGAGALAVGDVDGNGFGDLVVGDASGNAAYVLLSPGSGGPSGNINIGSADMTLTGAGGGTFGGGVAVGDFNGDGIADVAVGDATTGVVYVFQSSGGTPIANSTFSAAAVTLSGTAAEAYGTVMAAADMNGDGYTDLLVGDWGFGSNEGQVYFYPSTGSGGMGTSAGTQVLGQAASSFAWSFPR